MLRFVLFVVVAMVVAVALAGAAAALAVRRLRRPVELYPGARTGAPLRWRWSLSRSALLHRRLVVALASVRLTAASTGAGGSSGGRRRPGAWQDLIGEAETLAADVDRRLVLADAQPRTVRQRAVAGLEPDVAQVEQACGRLADTVRAWAATAPGQAGADLLDRIGAVDAALREVRAIDQDPADHDPADHDPADHDPADHDPVPALPPPAAPELVVDQPRQRVRRRG